MIKQIKNTELIKAFSMQKKCFKPIYEKYHDETSPCKEPFAIFVSRTTKSKFSNVHLYQKLGYKPNGKEKIINDKMTIIEFEKEINDE